MRRSLLPIFSIFAIFACGGGRLGADTGAGDADADEGLDADEALDAGGDADLHDDADVDVDVDADTVEPPPTDGYPRVFTQVWSGASPAWLAEFDWVISSSSDGFAELRELNPDVLTSITLDFNLVPPGTGVPGEWCVPTASGGEVQAYGLRCLGDTTDGCEQYEGQTYREWLLSWALGQDWALIDGINSDGIWGSYVTSWHPQRAEIDVDRDGDHDDDDVSLWRAGRLALFRELREALPEGALITMNPGTVDDYWGHGAEHLNGINAEKFLVFNEWHHVLDTYRYFAQNVSGPLMYSIANSYEWDPESNAGSRNNFRVMRFGLATTLLYDGYYTYIDGDGLVGTLGNNEAIWARYYDEFDVPLGQPLTDGPHMIREDVYCRFFEGGAMILNGSTSDASISEADLQSAASALGLDWATIAGEGGHFYRFAGQQNPEYNDGSLFESIALPSFEYSYDRRKGDGILLVRSPDQVAMAPAIIDTETFVTSPGAENAELDGFSGSCGPDRTNGFRTGYVHCSDVNPLWGYTEAGAGSSATATFTFEPVYEGRYRISEYHPSVDGGAVPYRVIHAEGEETHLVEQSQDFEQWNELGVYHLVPGVPARVIISAAEASGSVVAADAIRFELVGG